MKEAIALFQGAALFFPLLYSLVWLATRQQRKAAEAKARYAAMCAAIECLEKARQGNRSAFFACRGHIERAHPNREQRRVLEREYQIARTFLCIPKVINYYA